MLGQKIKEITNNTLKPGYYETNINLSNLASGVYFYKIIVISNTKNQEFSDSKKLILLK